MSYVRIGWVNPRKDGDQADMLRTHCAQIGLNNDAIVAAGASFQGQCLACGKKPAFTVLCDARTRQVGWACKECKEDFPWRGRGGKNKCYMCGEPVASMPSDVRNPAAYGGQYYDTCELCTPRVRVKSTGCARCDLLFEGFVCMRHELIRGSMKQCPACSVLHRGTHACDKRAKDAPQ